jgi:hypothetical protein
MMKKLALLMTMLAMGFMLFGCGTAAVQSEFWEHDTMYKNWEHTKYSMSGFKNTNAQNLQSSKAQKWWGKEMLLEEPK